MFPGLYNVQRAEPSEEKGTHEGTMKPKSKRNTRKGEQSGARGRKRKLSAEQVKLLELNFIDEHKLETDRKERLASQLGLDPRQVAIWFQNRRARWKNKKLEDDYAKLQALHHSVVLEICRLELQVMKLEERVREAESEIQRQSSYTINSAFSMEGLADAYVAGPRGPQNMIFQSDGAGPLWVNDPFDL